jgi:hypothetical protein
MLKIELTTFNKGTALEVVRVESFEIWKETEWIESKN